MGKIIRIANKQSRRIYLMSREIGRACELSCNEAVIRKLDTKGLRAYGDTLLKAIGFEGNYRNSLVSPTLNESEGLLKERLDAIMDFKKKMGDFFVTYGHAHLWILACAVKYKPNASRKNICIRKAN